MLPKKKKSTKKKKDDTLKIPENLDFDSLMDIALNTPPKKKKSIKTKKQ